MPIYIEFEEIKGTVNEVSQSKGGVWKTTNFLTGGNARNRVFSAYEHGFTGGVSVAIGSTNAVKVSRIIFPNAPAGLNFIDSSDVNAVGKARTIIGAQRSSGTFTLVFNGEVTGGAHNFRNINNLKQIALSGRRIPVVKLFIIDSKNQKGGNYRLENAIFTNISSGAQSDSNRPNESFSLNFTKIVYND